MSTTTPSTPSSTTASTTASTAASTSPDGRSRRWDAHRATRREELVDATLRAIREHGAGVGMDGIAAAAATSKTVFYRHFTDRAGLYAAVTERVAENILRDIDEAEALAEVPSPAETGLGPGRAAVGAAIDAYLALVEDEPEIYRFVVTAPLLDRAGAGDPSRTVSTRVAEHLSEQLELLTQNSRRAHVWAHGVVGMVRAAADDWLETTSRTGASTMPREELTRLLTDLAWSGLSG